tara:strand:+ start:11417 stop:11806 length:390 start_codon:yes stop_codon:yes gene_type:complete
MEKFKYLFFLYSLLFVFSQGLFITNSKADEKSKAPFDYSVIDFNNIEKILYQNSDTIIENSRINNQLADFFGLREGHGHTYGISNRYPDNSAIIDSQLILDTYYLKLDQMTSDEPRRTKDMEQFFKENI